MYRATMSLRSILISVTICACVVAMPTGYPSDQSSDSHQHLLHLAKVLNTLHNLEVGGKGTVPHPLTHGRFGGSRIRGDYISQNARASKQNEADKHKNLPSYFLTDQDDTDFVSKRQGGWDYDYGLGGGRFGKRTPGDYGIGGGRFGRDVSDVDHVDLLDAE